MGDCYQYNGYPEEAMAFAPPEDISFVDFTEKYIVLDPSISSEPGAKRISRTPALRPIYEALSHPDVREVDCRKSAQIAVTSIAFDLIAFCIVQKPRPIVYFLADQTTAEKVGERLRNTLKLCQPVADLIVEGRFNKSEMVFKNGASVTISWGSSIAGTASSPYGLVIIDEADKPGYLVVGSEGSTMARIRERCVTFEDYLIFVFSTPTHPKGIISAELEKCPIIVKSFVPCPHCGHKQPLFWGRKKEAEKNKYIGMDGKEHQSGFVYYDNEAETKEKKVESARYVCGECESTWTTAEKNSAVLKCEPWPWEIKSRMGFDGLPRMYSLFRGGRLEAMTETWLDSQDDIADLQTFVNSVLGQVWETTRETSSESDLKQAICENPWTVLPDAADCITAQVDMQQTGFWYVVRAWSAFSKDSWLIECGNLKTWDDVSDLFFERTWATESGDAMYCWRGAIDIGGSKEEGKDVSRTEEAYDWYISEWHRARRRVYLCKGSSRTLPTSLSMGKILEVTPSGKKIDRWGLQILELNTTRLKNLFFHGLKQAKEKGSKAAYLSTGTPDQYFRHITAEVIDANGEYKKIRTDNHWLDCEMMGYGIVSRELVGGLDGLARALGEHRESEKKQDSEPVKAPDSVAKQAETQEKPAEKQPEQVQKKPETQPKPAIPARKMGQNPWTRGTRFG